MLINEMFCLIKKITINVLNKKINKIIKKFLIK